MFDVLPREFRLGSFYFLARPFTLVPHEPTRDSMAPARMCLLSAPFALRCSPPVPPPPPYRGVGAWGLRGVHLGPVPILVPRYCIEGKRDACGPPTFIFDVGTGGPSAGTV